MNTDSCLTQPAIDTIAMLYELSLGIGTSLDLQENCQAFFPRLMSRINLSACGLFLRRNLVDGLPDPEVPDSEFNCTFALPGLDFQTLNLSPGTAIVQSISTGTSFSLTCSDWNELCCPNEIKWNGEGHACIFPLRDIGFLVCCANNKDQEFSIFERERLEAIMDQFAMSIMACLDHRIVLDNWQQLKRQYLHSQKMEAVGRLTGGIAHDFNNLLTVINSRVELQLLLIDEQDPLREHALAVQEAGTRAAALTSQLLLYSRRSRTAPKQFDLNDVVLKIKLLLDRIIGEDVVVDVELTSDSCQIQADPNQIEQAIMNLAVNARDAMPDGGALRISTRVRNAKSGNDGKGNGQNENGQNENGQQVQLTISDTGTGIPVESMSRIFEPYYTTKEVSSGSGLGLSVVLGVVEEAGGTIDANNLTDGGAEFVISFPQHRPAGMMSPAANSKSSRRAPDCVTILLVEDEINVRRTVELALKVNGFKVHSAGNAEEARRLSRQYCDSINLLLTDVVMPDVNGKELAQELISENPQWKLMFMSGHTDRHLQGLESDESRFIQKPFTNKQLANTITEMFKGIVCE